MPKNAGQEKRKSSFSRKRAKIFLSRLPDAFPGDFLSDEREESEKTPGDAIFYNMVIL